MLKIIAVIFDFVVAEKILASTVLKVAAVIVVVVQLEAMIVVGYSHSYVLSVF